jgi:hypothetical protein
VDVFRQCVFLGDAGHEFGVRSFCGFSFGGKGGNKVAKTKFVGESQYHTILMAL